MPLEVLRYTSENVFVPLTVGGGRILQMQMAGILFGVTFVASFLFWSVTHAFSGSWTHNFTLQPIIMGERSVGWAIAHRQFYCQCIMSVILYFNFHNNGSIRKWPDSVVFNNYLRDHSQFSEVLLIKFFLVKSHI